MQFVQLATSASASEMGADPLAAAGAATGAGAPRSSVSALARPFAGALDHIKMTPELRSKLSRVAANCDAEIIHAL